MIVVSDTYPLNYLLLIEAVNLLPTLYGVVCVPPAVMQEMLDAAAPESTRRWATMPPEWLIVQAPSTTSLGL